MWNPFRKRKEADPLVYTQLTQEEQQAKSYVLSIYSDASCHPANMYWPGQGHRRRFIVSLRSIDSMPHGEGLTEGAAWTKAAEYVAYMESKRMFHS